ncbi:MAG: hypothetical protein JWP63_4788 [Candidatus Solibacter sp.]|jgi:hypothetical protein|nr:hypothetical protein [Candidatus Solibacter sp.]
MKWVGIILGSLVLVVAIMAVVGAMLPRGHRATRQAHYRQKPEAIYFTLAGPVDWRTDVKAFGTLPDRDGRKQWWEQDSHGKKVTYELVEDKMPSRRVVRIADQGLPFGGTWTFDIAPAPEGSVVRITEDGEVYNVIFRFMARYFFGYYASIEGYLRDLGRRFGEFTQIEG